MRAWTITGALVIAESIRPEIIFSDALSVIIVVMLCVGTVMDLVDFFTSTSK